jgi:hypothetical protein
MAHTKVKIGTKVEMSRIQILRIPPGAENPPPSALAPSIINDGPKRKIPSNIQGDTQRPRTAFHRMATAYPTKMDTAGTVEPTARLSSFLVTNSIMVVGAQDETAPSNTIDTVLMFTDKLIREWRTFPASNKPLLWTWLYASYSGDALWEPVVPNV